MINAVVEGRSDEGVVRRIASFCGHDVAKVVAKGGKSQIDPLIPNYNAAAKRSPWIVFRDSDNECPKELLDRLLPPIESVSKLFLLRIVHPMTEAWLLADAENFAGYFQVKKSKIPIDPEGLAHPKQTLLALCAGSRSRNIRREMVAEGTKTGPLYTFRINEFAATEWNVESAAERSNSLRRALNSISRLET